MSVDEVREVTRAVQSLYLSSRLHKEETVDAYYATNSVFEDPLVYASGRHQIASSFRAIGWVS